MNKKINICFRLDDPGPLSDKNIETRICGIFHKYGGIVCVAVVPNKMVEGEKKISVSKENMAHLIRYNKMGTITIEQHGYSHTNNSGKEIGPPSEFFSLEYNEQLSLIKNGLKTLQTVFEDRITGFVPPWNSFDLNTVSVLNELGFEYISGSDEFPKQGHNRIIEGITLIPRTCSLRNVYNAVKQAERYRFLRPVIVVVMHPDDFNEFNSPPAIGEKPPFTNLDELESLLKFCQKNKNIKISSMRKIVSEEKDGLKLWLMQRKKWYTYLPWKLRSSLPNNIFLRSSSRFLESFFQSKDKV